MIDKELLEEMYAKRGYLFEWQVLLAEEAPEFLRAFDATWTQVNSDRPNGLAAKYRELVYATVASVLGEDTVAKNHFHKALDAGAGRCASRRLDSFRLSNAHPRPSDPGGGAGRAW
jgi:alkylhydroperoxidase/carboxymuconolactone decarboxylase family protein YurZ